MYIKSGLTCLCIALVACTPGTSIVDQYEELPATPVLTAPKPAAVTAENSQQVNHGAYMVELLGCGSCHTQGALIGLPESNYALAGSRIGIACSDPLQVKNPCVVFPPNLTPHRQSGIGRMPDEYLKQLIKNTDGGHGTRQLKVMPVMAYARLRDEDVDAIVSYLRSLAPVAHSVPKNVTQGRSTSEKYVHFGVYWSHTD